MIYIFDQEDDFVYDSYEVQHIAAVAFDRAWGFCDAKCFESSADLLAEDLQEVRFHLKMGCKDKVRLKVKLWIQSEEHCRNLTRTHNDVRFRAQVDRWATMII